MRLDLAWAGVLSYSAKPTRACGRATPMKKPQSLHSLLVRRLVVMSLLIALILSVLAVYLEFLRVKDVATDRALVSAGILRELLLEKSRLGTPTEQDVKNLLKVVSCEDTDKGSDLITGHFVLLRLFDPTGKKVPETPDDEHHEKEKYPGIKELELKPFVADHGDKLPDTSLAYVWLGWWPYYPYLEINQPLRDAQNRVMYDVQGFFDIVGPEENTLLASMARAVAIATGTVLLTSLLLYPVILRLVSRVTRLTRRLLDANLEALQVLGSTIAKRDSDTDEHNFRVTLYSVRLAEALKLDDHQIRLLIKGAFLHDVGKIGIRDNILLKPGKLEPAEFEEMKLHVAHGIDIISRSHWMNEAKPVVACHHEKVDGSGYPAGLKGDEIPLLARIFALTDVFDALTSERPYKKAFSYEEAIATLRFGSGTQFDQRILEIFLTISHPLFDLFADREDGAARREVEKIIERYYGADMAVLLE